MYTSNDAVAALARSIIDGTINDDIYFQAKKEAEAIKAENEKRRVEAKRKHEAEQAENKKPYKSIPFFERNKGSKEIMTDYLEYLRTHDIDALIIYVAELRDGKHKGEFKRNDFEVYQFVNAQLQARIAKLDPQQEKLRLLREAKSERSKIKEQIETIQQDTEKVKLEIDTAQAVMQAVTKSNKTTTPTYVT